VEIPLSFKCDNISIKSSVLNATVQLSNYLLVKYKVLLVVAIATILCVLYMMHVESDTEDAYSSR